MVGPLFAFGLHLPRHGVDQFGRRRDVLDLDARDLYAPGRGRLVDDAQQVCVDLVALGQQLVEVHRAHDRPDIRHGEIEDRQFETPDLVGRLNRIEHLVEHHAVHLHHGVVAGDDFLGWNVRDLLHHVLPPSDPIDQRHDQMQARRQRPGIAAEPFDGVFEALRHRLHTHEDQRDRQHDDDDDEDRKGIDHIRNASLFGRVPVNGRAYSLSLDIGRIGAETIDCGRLRSGFPHNRAAPAPRRTKPVSRCRGSGPFTGDRKYRL